MGGAGDEAVATEARIVEGVGHNEEVLGGLDGVRAEGDLARRLADVAKAAVGHEPLPANVDEGHEGDGDAEESLGQAGQPFEGRLSAGVEDEVGLKYHEAVGLLRHGLLETGLHEHVLGDPVGIPGVG